MESRPSAHRGDAGKAEPVKGSTGTFAALGDPKFRLLWLGSLLSFSAMQMTQVVRPYLAYELSGSGLVLGLVAAAQGVPMLLVAPMGGVAADRFTKRVVLLTSQGILLLTAAAIAALLYLDLLRVWHLVVLAFIHGCTVPFNQPVRQSYVPTLLNRRLMPNGVALLQSARNIDQVVAPSLAGLLLSFDWALTLAVIAGLHLVSMSVSIQLPPGHPQKRESKGLFGELVFGLRYVVGTPVLRTLVGLALIAVVFGYPYHHLLAIFKSILDASEFQFGLMYSAVGAGGLIGSLTVASFSRLATRGYPQLVAGIVFGLVLAGFALSPYYPLSLGLLFVLGFCAQSYMTMNQTLMMLHSDAGLYGRVASVNMMIRSILPITVLPMGALTDAFGAPATLAVSGCLLVLAVLGISSLMPSLWRERGP